MSTKTTAPNEPLIMIHGKNYRRWITHEGKDVFIVDYAADGRFWVMAPGPGKAYTIRLAFDKLVLID